MNVNEMFVSINGECCHTHQGSLTTFIRFEGCNLKPCSYCDTQYSCNGDKFTKMSPTAIRKELKKLECKNITVTGGEPLIQKGIVSLLNELVYDNSYNVSVETNGSIPLPSVHGSFNFSWVMDFKLPSSGNFEKMCGANISRLTSNDFVKFVVGTQEDFDTAMRMIPLFLKANKPKIVLSPVFKNGKANNKLVMQMINNKYLRYIGAIYSLQIHKIVKVK